MKRKQHPRAARLLWAAAALLSLLAGRAGAQVISGPDGPVIDNASPDVYVDPGDYTHTGPTAPTVGVVVMQVCDFSEILHSGVRADFRGQSYPATRDPSVNTLPGCSGYGRAYQVNIPVALQPGNNVLVAHACDVRGHCTDLPVTYTYVVRLDAPPVPQLNFENNGSVTDSTWALRVGWSDDKALVPATARVTVNGTVVTGLSYTTVSLTSGSSSGTLQLARGWNTVVATIADSAGQTGTATARLFSDRTAPTVTFAPDSVRTADSIYNVAVQVSDDMALPSTIRWAVSLNGIDVSGLYFFSGGSDGESSTAALKLRPGFNEIIARACDAYNRCGGDTARHVFRYLSARERPQVSLEPQLQTQRIPNPFEPSMVFSTPEYVSRDQPRSVSLVYFGGQAQPRGTVEVDVADHSAQAPRAFSIRVLHPSGNAVTPEIFYGAGSGTTRLVATWDASGYGTSALVHTVLVRSYWSDGTYQETSTPVRVVVVDERNSAFGAGWSLAGAQRLHVQADGSVVLTEGNGRASVFLPQPCVTTSFTRCPFTSPDGDFTTLNRYPASGNYTRTYPDAGSASFNSLGLITETADRLGQNKTLYGGWQSVGGRWQLGSITDPAGKVLHLEYHTTTDIHAGKLAAVTDPGGRITRFGYWDGWNNLTHVQDPDAGGVSFAYLTDAAATRNVLQRWKDRAGGTWILGLDHAGLMSSLQVPGTGATGTVRSAMARVLPAAATTLAAPAPRVPADETWNVVRPAAGDSAVFALDRWREVSRSRDENGTVERTIRNAHGQEVMAILHGDTVSRGWNGPNLAMVAMNGDTVTSYTYQTAWTCCAPYAVLKEVRSGSGSVFERYWWDSRGLLDSARVNAVTTRYTHDAAGRVRTVTDEQNAQTSIAYDSLGYQNTRSVTTPAGTTQRTYDGLGRQARVVNPLGEADSVQYDAVNRVTHAADALRNITRFHYGPAYADSVTDAWGQRWHSLTDVLGRDTLGRDPAGRRTRTWYNTAGQPDSIRDRLGRMTRFRYDTRGRMVERRAVGDTTYIEYDPQDRFTVVRNSVSTDTTYGYDPREGAAEVTLRSGSRYRTAWTDSYQSVAQRFGTEHFYPHTRTLTLRVNDAQAAQMAVHDYDFDEQPVRIAGPDRRAIGVQYGSRKLLDALVYPGGDTVGFTYTDTRALSRIRYSRPALESILGTLYRRDALGRVVRRYNTVLDSGWVFRYDAAGQLLRHGSFDPGTCSYSKAVTGYDCSVVSIDTTRWAHYAYDAGGNRTDQGADVRHGPRLLRFGAYTMEYDSAGFMTRKYQTSNPAAFDQVFTWNGLGQLVRVTTNGAPVTFAYDGLGRRVRKVRADGSVEQYVYSGQQLVAELDGTGAERATYTYLPGADLPLTMTRGGKTYYYQRNHQGSITALTDSLGTLVNEYRYDAWGVTTVVRQNVANPFAYAGRELDRETGLYYLRARYYDPQAGRFISQDPIGLAGGMNVYAYVENDPVNLKDPSGLSPVPAAQEDLGRNPWLESVEEIVAHCTENSSSFGVGRLGYHTCFQFMYSNLFEPSTPGMGAYVWSPRSDPYAGNFGAQLQALNSDGCVPSLFIACGRTDGSAECNVYYAPEGMSPGCFSSDRVARYHYETAASSQYQSCIAFNTIGILIGAGTGEAAEVGLEVGVAGGAAAYSAKSAQAGTSVVVRQVANVSRGRAAAMAGVTVLKGSGAGFLIGTTVGVAWSVVIDGDRPTDGCVRQTVNF